MYDEFSFDVKIQFYLAIVLIIVAIGLGLAGKGDKESAEINQQEYCTMVALHKKTNGTQGWPDYENKFNRVCV